MTEEEKLLVFKDLSARLPYGVKMKVTLDLSYDTSYDSVEQHCNFDATLYAINIDGDPTDILIYHENDDTANYLNEQFTECPDILEDFIPYLRPIVTMTEEEKTRYLQLCDTDGNRYFDTCEALDYLNSIHVDHRFLIQRGLALAAPDGMYNF